MPILDYTTKVPVDRTVGEVLAILGRQKARSITITNDDKGNPVGVSFVLKGPKDDYHYELPVNVDGVWKVMTTDRDQGIVQPRFATREQAARIAWRITKDWLEAQLALVRAGMVVFEQIMLPYMLLTPGGPTVYESFAAEERLKALPAGGQS
jgi:hypothetical protein